jgi:tRNA A37 methylthiotransferase MiaB
VGRRFEVLIEGVSRRGQPTGRTSCNRIVHVDESGPIAPGTYVEAVVTKGLPNSLLGRIVSRGGPSW